MTPEQQEAVAAHEAAREELQEAFRKHGVAFKRCVAVGLEHFIDARTGQRRWREDLDGEWRPRQAA